MRIVCPVCSATYEVSDSLLAPGRTVRCARCEEEWTPVSATPSPPPESALVPVSEPAATPGLEPDDDLLPPPRQPREGMPPLSAMERLASRPAPLPRGPAGVRAAWGASILLLIVFGWGLIAWRGDIMHAWPPSERLYDLLGLVPSPQAR